MSRTERSAADESFARSSVAVWRPSALLRFEVRHSISTRPTCARHAHETYCIMLTERGRANLRVGEHSLEVGPGEVFVLQPGETHHGGAARGDVLEYRSIYPDPALVDQAAERSGVNPAVTFDRTPIRDARVADLLRSASAPFEATTNAAEREFFVTEALGRLMAEYGSDASGERPARRSEVDAAKRYIEAHLAERITLSELALVVGLSPSYIGRLFREEVGVSPHEYQIHQRVVRAKELLEDGVPLAEAATRVGFFDQAHLHRHFSKIMRITPGRYGVPPDA